MTSSKVLLGLLCAGLLAVWTPAVGQEDTGTASQDPPINTEAAPTPQGPAPCCPEMRQGDCPDCPGCGHCGHGCGHGRGYGRGGGSGSGRGRGPGYGRGGGCHGCGHGHHGRAAARRGHHRAEMQEAWALLDGHEAIERTVEEIPGGVRTVTTTTDPKLVPVLRRHVADMASLLDSGGRIRNWDPLFAEIFDLRHAIDMEIEYVENGVEVTETSADPEVVKLIRAHARKVDQFVARDGAAYREETPLPEDYGVGRR